MTTRSLQRPGTTRRAFALAAATFTLVGAAGTARAAETILFIGNSFTYAAGSAVQTFQPGSVSDLNGSNIGGIPALFKSFTQQAGLDYSVSLETVGGSGLDLHYNTKKPLIDKAWDNVVMHTDLGLQLVVGSRVSIGHGAVIHGCHIEDDCLIGMNATILNGAVIGAGSLVAAGSVVLENTVVPPGSR